MKNVQSNKVLNALIAVSIFAFLIFAIIIVYPGRNNFQMSLLLPWSNTILKGWGITVVISLITLFFSLILGFGLYLLESSNKLYLRYLSSIFNDFVFGSPLVVFVLIIYYFIAVPVNLNNRFIAGVIALSLYMAPYMKNMFEGAMKTIDQTQYQAMTVFGFTTYQKYRYIILPQLIRVIVPTLIGNLTFIVKGSSLLNFISVPELYNQITTAQSNTYAVVEGYLLMLMMYLIITIPLIRLTKFFEKKVSSWS